jgi:hypothetical protein
MLSNISGETLQKPNDQQRLSRFPSSNSISNSHLASVSVRVTEQVKKILAVKNSCVKNCTQSLRTVLHAKSSKVKTADPKWHQGTMRNTRSGQAVCERLAHCWIMIRGKRGVRRVGGCQFSVCTECALLG